MKSMQSGFTLIELVIVIVILGVLAALAVPRFVNLQGDAQAAALNANAAAINSAMSINYAACAVKNFVIAVPPADCRLVNSCGDVTEVLNAALPTGYSVVADTAIGAGNGSTLATCSLAGPSGNKSFTAIRTGPD